MTGSNLDAYPPVRRDEAGGRELMRQISLPLGMSSRAARQVPVSSNDGGEPVYRPAHAFGGPFDNPGFVAACMVGDGEPATGPLTAVRQSTTFLDPVHDGAVVPIPYLKGDKNADPTRPAGAPDAQLVAMVKAFGWSADVVDAEPLIDDPSTVHALLATVFDKPVNRIPALQRQARDRNARR
jgi:xylulose-5-phosphate/fructose-6-phosphate phosphoketolase